MRHIRQFIVLCAILTLFTLSAQAHSPALSQGQENIVKRARQLSEIEWTPVEDIYQWNYAGTFRAGTTYRGVPYGQPVETGGYIGWDLSLDRFAALVSDSGSKLYSAYSWYNKLAPYYSTDCSGYVSYAWQTGTRLSTTSLSDYGVKVASQSVNAIQVGDVLNLAGTHVVLISAVDVDASGQVAGLQVMEATPPIARTTGYGTLGPQNLETFRSRYFGRGYVLLRNPNRDSVSYTHSCAVPIDGDSCQNCAGSAIPFRDVSAGAWYCPAVGYVYQSGLYTGTTATAFSPNSPMTRGMFVTALSRLAGVPAQLDGELALVTGNGVRLRSAPDTSAAVLGSFSRNEAVGVVGSRNGWYQVSAKGVTGWVRGDLLKVYDGRITDLRTGRYDTNAVKWACLMGIAGAAGGDFRAGDSILRQDMAVMLYRYARACGAPLSGSASGGFRDDASLSAYAREAVYALMGAGIISGTGGGHFQPQSTATRAQVAQIFLNYQNWWEKS